MKETESVIITNLNLSFIYFKKRIRNSGKHYQNSKFPTTYQQLGLDLDVEVAQYGHLTTFDNLISVFANRSNILVILECKCRYMYLVNKSNR